MKQTTETNCIFPISDPEQVKQKVLNWTKRFDTFCFLDNHQYPLQHHSEECLLAAGVKRKLEAGGGNGLDQLQDFIKGSDPASPAALRRNNPGASASNLRQSEEDQIPGAGWFFGHIGYDLKNEIESLRSGNPDHIGFPDLFFFEPEIMIRLSATEMAIDAADPVQVFKEISGCPVVIDENQSSLQVRQRFSKEEYIAVIEDLKRHILRGDCYEINFCQEFFVENAVIDPVHLYQRLSSVSPNPFSALYRNADQWLVCASPERFLRREGNTILSQPIKGTSKRVREDRALDEESKASLESSAKDRSENVMVVDLVRNDLAKICREGTVSVEELFHVYSFPQVHQMISTIRGELEKDISFSEIIKATFPMGSMTGAPKKRVMELIEEYEKTKRGIFSGALGYISPQGDFDFNVVIRSIMYNAATQYLSFQAGSGITWYSEAEKEWEECLLKAEAIEEVLKGGE